MEFSRGQKRKRNDDYAEMERHVSGHYEGSAGVFRTTATAVPTRVLPRHTIKTTTATTVTATTRYCLGGDAVVVVKKMKLAHDIPEQHKQQQQPTDLPPQHDADRWWQHHGAQ